MLKRKESSSVAVHLLIVFRDDNMSLFTCLSIVLFAPLLASGQVVDPVAFTAIRGSLNGNYVAFATLIVNNNVSDLQYYH